MIEGYLATDKNGEQNVFMCSPIRHDDGYWYDPHMPDFRGELPGDLTDEELALTWEDDPIVLHYGFAL